MNFTGTDHISTIELAQHKTCSIGIQCNFLAVAPLQKLPNESATTTTEYANGNEEVELDTGDADVEADHNTRDANLDTSYQLLQEDTTTEYIQVFHQQLHHQFAMKSNILSSSHPCYSYLQTVHHGIVGPMVRLLTERELSLPPRNAVPTVDIRGPGQVSHTLEISQLVTTC